MIKGKEKELEVAKPTKEEGCESTKMESVEVTREESEEVKDGEEGKEPHHASWDHPCNYVVTITKRCDDCDPYLDEVLDFTIHLIFFCDDHDLYLDEVVDLVHSKMII